MTPLVTILGLLAAVGLAALASKTGAKPIPISLPPRRFPQRPRVITDDAPLPSTPRPRIPGVVPEGRPFNRSAVVSFTPKKILWRTIVNKKTGEQTQQYRTLIEQPVEDLKASAEAKLGRAIPTDVFYLATMVASEEGRASMRAKIGVAWAAKNEAAREKRSLPELLTRTGKKAIVEYRFGSQQGRYASTRNPPSEEDLYVAKAVVDETIPDITQGATHFDSPKAQRALIAKREPGYDPSNTPDAVAESRRNSNLELVLLPDIPEDELRFWRPRTSRTPLVS